MKIVNIEDFFHPEAGYQMNILGKYMVKMGNEVTMITAEPYKIPEYIKKFFDCSNINEKDHIFEDQYGMKIVRLPIRGFVSGRSVFSWKKLRKAILDEKPDVLFVHGVNTLTAVMVLKSSLIKSIPIVMDCHMTDMASVNKARKLFELAYKIIATPVIVKKHIPVIRIQDENYVQNSLSIPLSQAPFISVGSDTLLFHPSKEARREFRKKYGISNDTFLIMYAGKLDEYKGGQLLADAILKKIEADKNVEFVIVGQAVGEYGEKVEGTLTNSENRIYRLPTQKYNELAPIYQACDIAVFPRQCSLSFYDVQACGLPVIFEDNEVNIGRARNNNAFLFKAGDVRDFRRKIYDAIELSEKEYNIMRDNAIDFVKNNYDYCEIAKQYMEVIKDVEKRKNCDNG